MSPARVGRSGLQVRPARLLLIDDDACLRFVLGLLLREEYDVRVASGAAEALERLRAGERYEVILCDVMMPEASGPDFRDAVAREVPALERAIVFMTGGLLDGALRERMASLPNPCLAKPFALEQLRSIVRERVADGGPSSNARGG